MSELKVTASHLRRAAVVYVRQSTLAQVDRNRESTARQYDLVTRAVELGWPRSAVRVIDDDLGVSGASVTGRFGFAELAAQVGLGQVGIVLSLECSRLARNNADWYRLLDLAGMADTLIADTDGVYHPALFNDRLVLGMKGRVGRCPYNGRKLRHLNCCRSSARNLSTPIRSSTKAAVFPSTPAERAPLFPATRSHAINKTSGSVTRLYRSSNRR
jgi:hypothetical protein